MRTDEAKKSKPSKDLADASTSYEMQEDEEMSIDAFDQNISEKDVYSTYNVVKSPVLEVSLRKQKKSSKKSADVSIPSDTWFAKPKSKSSAHKSSRSTVTQVISKPKSYIQPTLDYFQQETPDLDFTYCKELDSQKAQQTNASLPAEIPKMIVLSPKTKSALSAANKSGYTKSQLEIVEEVERMANEQDLGEKIDTPLNIKCEKISPERNPLSLRKLSSKKKDENKTHAPSTSILFRTDGETLTNSVIIIDSESENQPIHIEDTLLSEAENKLPDPFAGDFPRYDEPTTDIGTIRRSPLAMPPLQNKVPDRFDIDLHRIPEKSTHIGNRRKSPEPARQKYDCKDCEAFYQYLTKNFGPDEMRKRFTLCSKHKKPRRPDTPEGFWNLGFSD